MTAAAVMDPNPVTLKPDDQIGTAARCIMDHRFRNVPVVDDEGRYLGIFGVNCLLKMVLPHAAVMQQGLDNLSFIHESTDDLHKRLKESEHLPLSDCMSTDPVVVPPDMPLLDTLLILYRNKTSIPVVEPDTGKLVGMISYWDVGRKVMGDGEND